MLWILGWMTFCLLLSGLLWGLECQIKKARFTERGVRISYPILLSIKLVLIVVMFHAVYGIGLRRERFFLDHENFIVELLNPLGLYFVGHIDDRHGLSGRVKAAIIGAVWVMVALTRCAEAYAGNHSLGLDRALLQPLLGFFLTIALPLLDGMNGLFALFSASAIIALNRWSMEDCCDRMWTAVAFKPGYWVAFLFAVALLSFLPWNLLKDGIRLGEAAVLPVGYILALKAGEGIQLPAPDPRPWFLSGAIMLLPALDFVLVIWFRLRRRRSPFRGGHDHLLHRLQQSGWSPMRALALLAGPAAALAGWKVLFVIYGMAVELSFEAAAPWRFAGSAIAGAGALCTCLLFWRGYTKVDPYQSGAVDERGRP